LARKCRLWLRTRVSKVSFTVEGTSNLSLRANSGLAWRSLMAGSSATSTTT
jgi:hypothetical protein